MIVRSLRPYCRPELSLVKEGLMPNHAVICCDSPFVDACCASFVEAGGASFVEAGGALFVEACGTSFV